MRRPTGIQEVAGSILGPATYLSQRFGHEIISTVILSLPLIHQYGHLLLPVNRLGTQPGYFNWSARHYLNRTDWAVKYQNKQTTTTAIIKKSPHIVQC